MNQNAKRFILDVYHRTRIVWLLVGSGSLAWLVMHFFGTGE